MNVLGTTSATGTAAGRRTWDWRATVVTVAAQVLMVVGAYHAYRFVRTLTEGDRARAIDHSHLLLRFEERLGLDVERGLQSLVLPHPVLVDVVNRLYVWCFWPFVSGTLIALFVFSRQHYRHFRNALFLSGGVGLVVFGLFPVAPPRMLDGYVDTVHVFTDATSFARPGNFTNEFAAMPSFHVGWLVLAGAAAMPAIPWRAVRPLAMLPAILMTFTVMATANHYLVDALAGAAVVLAALHVSHRLPAPGSVRARLGVAWEQAGGLAGVSVRVGRGIAVGAIALGGGRAATVAARQSVDPPALDRAETAQADAQPAQADAQPAS